MFRDGGWRLCGVGAPCGVICTVAVWVVSIWWTPHPERSTQDSAIYDNCLLEQRGNTVACDAMMRLIVRERASEVALKEEATNCLRRASPNVKS
jgi:hypothetical protein